MIDELPWDSAHFGFAIGRARPPLDGVIAEARARGLRCVYLLAPDVATVRAAEEQGFRTADVRVTFERRLDDAPAPSRGFAIRDATGDDEATLRAEAAGAFTESRFWADPGFPRERCAALYATWISNDLRDHRVRMLDDGGGWISIARQGDAASIGLVAVSPRRRGAGAGAALVADALALARSSGARTMSVVTQGGNVAAQRLYQRAGFVTRAQETWLHLWITA